MSPERLQYLIDEHGGWPLDSLSGPAFVVDLEEELGRTIDGDELFGITSIEELRAWLQS